MPETTIAPARGARLALLVGGVVAALFGIAILVWPTKAAVAVTALIAVYAVIGGIVYVFMGLTSRTLGAGGRIGHVLLGLLYVVAGVFAFTELQRSAAFLALFYPIAWLVQLCLLGAIPALMIVWMYRRPRELVVALSVTSFTSLGYGALLLWAFFG